jgi:hypothetical protein
MQPARIEHIANRLYAAPADILFHYTSLRAMQSMLKHRSIWATDIRYFSDAAELRHLMNALHEGIEKRDSSEVLRQFHDWLSERLPRRSSATNVATPSGGAVSPEGGMVFAVSFSAQGDLLSQWRAYSPPGKGVSLGFDPAVVARLAAEQSFSVGRCLYDRKKQEDLVNEILDALTSLAVEMGEDPKREATQSYYGVFQAIETPLLRIGALFKHPAFREEVELRAVSPVLTNVVDAGIRYREGSSTLVPYLEFQLESSSSPMPLTNVFVGPTPHVTLASDAIHRCARSHGTAPDVLSSIIPYRTW